jgi:hypothetical protein
VIQLLAGAGNKKDCLHWLCSIRPNDSAGHCSHHVSDVNPPCHVQHHASIRRIGAPFGSVSCHHVQRLARRRERLGLCANKLLLLLGGREESRRLGDYREKPEAEAILPTMEEAVSWLREQVKARYPDSDYAKRLLTN